MALRGTIIVVFNYLCPCFRSKTRDSSEDPVLESEMIAVNWVLSPERRSGSDRFPASPLRSPRSPLRNTLSPKPSKKEPIDLTLGQIIRITHNFSPSFKIGEGGFGTVYKAELPDGLTVAIKRARKEHFAALRAEFSNEVSLLTKIEHKNLVQLLGYIDKGTELIIITEYVPNGTLREHLDGQRGSILTFNQRLEIAIDVAHGLTYLHLYAEKPIIHRDVKPTNILLTNRMGAKVADFGFARTGPTEAEQSHVETKVKGTAGYVDPEYLRTYCLSPKSDVFSFGILLLEILSGRRPVELKRHPDEKITVRWAFGKYNQGRMTEILDPMMREKVPDEVLKRTLNLAFHCAAPYRRDRPTMKEACEKLWKIRRLYHDLRDLR